ncbi:MAG TPA: hypothetical protein VND99_05840 [Candidatus Acidoferrales bacterium]|nr:hypothetical protein [Candidatus Acidoferrales bacterium]
MKKSEKLKALTDKYPYFDDQLADMIIDKHVIVGYTYLKSDGTVDHQDQKYGLVIKTDKKKGVGILLHKSSEVIWLPPDLRSWRIALPGKYRAISTGEEITNPDYLTTWVVTYKK